MEQKKHIIIFSHGFGTRKDDRGLLTDIANAFPQSSSVLFDYNEINETEKIFIVHPLSEQAEMLKNVIEKTRRENPDAVIDIVAHSQGCIVPALFDILGVRKTVFIAPSVDADIDHTINMFKDRPGTEINLFGVSKLARKDGTVTIVSAEFWEERKKIEPIPLYNHLSTRTDLLIIQARQDEILGTPKLEGLSNKIDIKELDGNHQFGEEARQPLIHAIRTFLS